MIINDTPRKGTSRDLPRGRRGKSDIVSYFTHVLRILTTRMDTDGDTFMGKIVAL